MLRAGTGIKKIYLARHQVLQVMVMAVEINLHPMLMQQRQDALN